MKLTGNRILFGLVGAGLVAGFVSAYVSGAAPHVPPPVFNPSPDPFANGLYANGIVESYQGNGKNTNIYPEVSGTVTSILVSDGKVVSKGDVLMTIDDSVQRATTEQIKALTAAARAMLAELRAQPRRETLAVAKAQVDLASANLRTSESELARQQGSYQLDPRSISKLALDNAVNAAGASRASLDVATRQYELTKAGAWIYDIQNQEHQAEALTNQHLSAKALLEKYTIRAPHDGVVLQVETALGSYVSPAGVYDPYTQMNDPILVMGDVGVLAVRAYIDEILIPRMPEDSALVAKMFIRGTNISVPLEFSRVQPYVTPKIQLSNERTEKVDLRVLPVIFKFTPPKGVRVYPGQLVDVYLAARTPPGGPLGGRPRTSGRPPADAGVPAPSAVVPTAPGDAGP
jgi:HlyD family secretion protein